MPKVKKKVKKKIEKRSLAEQINFGGKYRSRKKVKKKKIGNKY